MTLFVKVVFEDVIKQGSQDEIILDFRWVGFSQVLNPMTSVLISDEKGEDTSTEKRIQEGERRAKQ